MSSLFGKLMAILGLRRRDANILVVGLDNSGKSTILNYLKRKEDQVEEVVPTVGFTVERLSGMQRHRSGIQLTAYDMSGQGRYRNLWEHYSNTVDGIIFVVDSTDSLRLVVARDELNMLLNNRSNGKTIQRSAKSASEVPDSAISTSSNTFSLNNAESLDTIVDGNEAIRGDVPILFFANKTDLTDSLPVERIIELLGLESLSHRNWTIVASNALSGQGIADGVEWLVNQIAKNTTKPNGNSRDTLSSSTSASVLTQEAKSN